MTGDHLQELRDQGKVRPRLTPTEVAWAGRYIIAATIAWLIAELAGAASRERGDTLTEVMQWAMAAHPLAAWSLAAAWAGLCVWLVPHFVAGLDWRWLVWLVVAFVAAAAATYGLLHVGMLRLP